MMKAAASSNGMESGIFTSRLASSASCSAMPPQPVLPSTRSPGFTWVTPSPTDFTTPETSPPGANGRSGLNWYLSSMISTSGKFTPIALTSTTAWPGFAAGSATSSSTRVSGPPTALLNSAFISALPGSRLFEVAATLAQPPGRRKAESERLFDAASEPARDADVGLGVRGLAVEAEVQAGVQLQDLADHPRRGEVERRLVVVAGRVLVLQ